MAVDSHASQEAKGKPIKRALMDLIVRHGKVKAVGVKKPVSNRTQDWREATIYLLFKQLKAMGHRLQRPEQLREWHIKKLVAKWEEEKLSASTIQNRLTVARMLSSWIGKAGMVRKTEEYVSDPASGKRTAVASYDHSWRAQGIDKVALIRQIGAYDPYVGQQLRLMAAFGLRREEAVMFKPHRVDQGDHIIVRDGTKGGRERSVPIDHDWQRKILDETKALVARVNGHIGHPDRNLKQALRRFNYVLERHGVTKSALGITSHGLRHERFNDMFEEAAGIPAPVRSQQHTQESAAQLLNTDPNRIDLARARVSSAAGHNRLSITNAYIGSTAQAKRSAMNWTIPENWKQEQEIRNWNRLGELKRLETHTTAEEQEYQHLQQQLGIQIQQPQPTQPEKQP